jgi:hypothetical protein
MTDPHPCDKADLVEHKGYHIRLSASELEWVAFVTQLKQRPTLILAPDREAALAKACEWIEAQLASAKDPA